MPGPLRGVRMDSPDTLRARWITEQQRLTMYRRQRASVHCDTTRSLDEIVADAEDLDRCIFLTLALMEEIEDERNAHTEGTWTYSQHLLLTA